MTQEAAEKVQKKNGETVKTTKQLNFQLLRIRCMLPTTVKQGREKQDLMQM